MMFSIFSVSTHSSTSGFALSVFQYALDNAKQLSISHLCNIILSFARLNFQPSGSEDFFNMVTCLLFPSLSTFLLLGVSGKAAHLLA